MNDQYDSAADSPDATIPRERFRVCKAILDLQPIVEPEPLRVTGEYFLDMRCGGIKLRKAVPQGINECILILDVEAEGSGDGGWEPFDGRFKAERNQYDGVELRDEKGNRIKLEIEVLD